MALNPDNGAAAPFCWGCRAVLSPEQRYCHMCGRGQGRFVGWYYKPWGIFLLTVLALGPFGLLLVFRSPVLSAWGRVFHALVAVLYTVYLVWAVQQTYALLSPYITATRYVGAGLAWSSLLTGMF